MLRLTKAGSLKSSFPIRAKINPDSLLEDSLGLFRTLHNQTRPLKVVFVGEKGSDVGGLTTSLFRRFFQQSLASEILFEQHCGSHLPRRDADLESLFSFGIAISRCLFDERVVELPLSSAVFKYLFDSPVDYADLETFDEQEAVQLKSLLRSAGVDQMGLSFEFAGGSPDVEVTDLNKEEFVREKIKVEKQIC
jgi:hypothetical protein